MTIKPELPVDHDRAVAAFREFMEALGYNIEADEGLNADASGKDTPQRAAEAYIEFLGKQQDWFDVTVFPSDSTGIVAATGLEFQSLCCHHMLPYFGVAHIGYAPKGKVAGLSKLVRVLDHYAHRISIQEQVTAKVVTFIEEQLKPVGCGVVIEAEHMCMSMRGVCRPGHRTVTSEFRGSFQDPAIKAEFLALIRDQKKGG
jgi:GTP cyclohydrolase I